MDKYGKRLVAARKYANNMTQQELSAKLLEKFSCKLTQQAISHLESECNDAGGSEYTAQISSICGIDSVWLASGMGTMVPESINVSDPMMIKAIKSLEKMPTDLRAQQIQGIYTLTEQIEKIKHNGTQ